MADKVCSRCGEAEVRRERRASWMKTLAYVVPLRPQICANCDARSWSFLQAGDGLAPWISSLTIWSVGLLVLWLAIRGPQGEMSPPADPPVAARRSTPTADPLPSVLPAATPTTAPTAEPEAAATAAPSAVPTAEPTVKPTALPTVTAQPTAKPASSAAAAKAKGKLSLSGVEATTQGEMVEIVLESDAENLKYTLTKSRYIKGYVLDLPGAWTVGSTVQPSRDFGQTNLKQLRVEQHDKFLRVVFQVRDNSGAAPVIERQGGRLRIEVR